MAYTDKNLIITPNVGSSVDDPKIVFYAANANVTAQAVTVRAYATSNGTISFEGSAGQLFAITNSLSSNTISTTGSVNATSVIATTNLSISGKSVIDSSADGNFRLSNNAGTSFGLLQFGGTTSAFPALKRSGTQVAVRLADDSDYTDVNARALFANTSITSTTNISVGVDLHLARNDGTSPAVVIDHFSSFRLVNNTGQSTTLGVDASSNYTVTNGLIVTGSIFAGVSSAHGWTGRSSMTSPADGNILITNNAGTGFGRLQFGGSTSAFSALKSNGTSIAHRLADDSADAAITAGAGTFSGQVTSTVTTGTAPLVVTSTTAVTNLNADLLDGQHGVFYQNATNITAGTLAAAQMPALSGDITTSAGTTSTVLATVNSNIGAFGSATVAPIVTVNAKGLITAVSTTTITPAWSSITSTPTTRAGYGITDAQPLNSNLTAYAGANWSAGVQVPALTAANTISLKTVGAAAGNLLDRASGDSLYLGITATAANATLLNAQPGSFYTNASNLNAGAVPAARMPALTGDATSSAGSVTLTLATVNSNIGTYGNSTYIPQITVNAKGLVTGISNVAVTGGTGSIYYKDPVASTANTNVTVSNPATTSFDGYTAGSGDRILLWQQSNAAENGIYAFNGSSSAMTRSSDADTWTKLAGSIVYAMQGTTYGDQLFTCTSDPGGTIGTTSVSFSLRTLWDSGFDGGPWDPTLVAAFSTIYTTGTGSSQNISLPVSGHVPESLMVQFGQVTQNPSSYSVSGTTLTVTAPSGVAITVRAMAYGNGVSSNAVTTALGYTAEKRGTFWAINTQTGASYTLALTDVGSVVETNNASANTLTVPPNASVAFPTGTKVDVVQYGAGQTTVTAGAGVTIRSAGTKMKTNVQYSRVTLYKRATDEWVLSGDTAL